MTTVIRWIVVGLVGVHALIHLLGAAEGLGWADVAQLDGSVSTPEGIAWLLTALVVGLAAVMIAFGTPTWWWIVAAVAAVMSQVMVGTAWDDAKAGSLANLVLLLVAVLGFAALGPTSPRARWQREAEAGLQSTVVTTQLLTEDDLVGLPAPLADYIRHCGALGKPRVANFVAEVEGRIRGGPDQGWMKFSGRQVSTYGATPQRFLLMIATKYGIPIAVTHVFNESSAVMRGRLLSLFTVVDGSGPDMECAETVTLFNDLVVMAPGAIPFASVTWTPIDDHHVSGAFVRQGITVSATLTFNDAAELTDFVSDDRLRASKNGSSFTRMRWSTPIAEYHQVEDRRAAVCGAARWHAPEPEGTFTYLDFRIDSIKDNVDLLTNAGATSSSSTGTRVASRQEA